MKKKTKKLVLAKETVRSLEVSTLSTVVGGMHTDQRLSCVICEEQDMSTIC